MRKQAILFAILLHTGRAFADWIDPGVAYKCDTHKGMFILTAVMETSSPEDPGEIPVEDGFKVLSKEKTPAEIKCLINGNQVSATFEIIPPAERGMCAAYNHFTLRSVQVNGKKIFEYELFNSGCFFSPVLYRIELYARKKDFLIKSCRGEWDWGKGYREGVCEKHATQIPRRPR